MLVRMSVNIVVCDGKPVKLYYIIHFEDAISSICLVNVIPLSNTFDVHVP